MSDDLCFLPATELAARIRRRDVSPVELVDAFLRRIDQRNPRLNGYVHVLHEGAREAARHAEQALTSGAALGPLHGVPIGIKDLFDFKAGVPNTFGSKPLKDFVPQQTASYVADLEAAGAIVLGKTNTPEFGHKGVTDNLIFGATSTPFKIGKNAGGSSGGSAAVVADFLAPIAQGSDGGGSIRIPASFCGAFGMKASFGRVANVMRPNAYISHTPFIHTGPIARTVDDGALMLSVMARHNPRDPFSLPADGMDFLGATRRSIQGWRIAFSPNFGVFPVDPRVAAVVADAVKAFELAGAHVEEVRVDLKRPQAELAEVWHRQIGVISVGLVERFKADGVADLWGEHRNDLTSGFAAHVERGMRMSALDYKQDDEIRSEVFDAVQDVFESYDLLVTPTLAVPPVDNASDGTTIGPTEINGETVDPLIGWCMTYPINFSGHPAASVPAGLTDDGLPIGMQIIGRRFADDTVLAASAAIERVRPWHHTYPRD